MVLLDQISIVAAKTSAVLICDFTDSLVTQYKSGMAFLDMYFLVGSSYRGSSFLTRVLKPPFSTVQISNIFSDTISNTFRQLFPFTGSPGIHIGFTKESNFGCCFDCISLPYNVVALCLAFSMAAFNCVMVYTKM